MRGAWRRSVAWVMLAAFTAIHGWAFAQTMPRCVECPDCAGLTCVSVCFKSDECIACSEECCCKDDQDSVIELGGEPLDKCNQFLSRSCPCHQRSSNPAFPCPGGCSYCSVAKAPYTDLKHSLFLPTSSLQWRLADISNCYTSPFSGRSTPPPRA